MQSSLQFFSLCLGWKFSKLGMANIPKIASVYQLTDQLGWAMRYVNVNTSLTSRGQAIFQYRYIINVYGVTNVLIYQRYYLKYRPSIQYGLYGIQTQKTLKCWGFFFLNVYIFRYIDTISNPYILIFCLYLEVGDIWIYC